jgi:hypothetical protein
MGAYSAAPLKLAQGVLKAPSANILFKSSIPQTRYRTPIHCLLQFLGYTKPHRRYE